MHNGTCERCGAAGWVNAATLKTVLVGHFCGECFDRVTHDDPKPVHERVGPFGRWSGPTHSDPGFDDAVRALEEFTSGCDQFLPEV